MMRAIHATLLLVTSSMAVALVAQGSVRTPRADPAGTVMADSGTGQVAGLSVRELLDQTVYSGAGHDVGRVQDVIVAPDRGASDVIIAVGGFIGIGRRDVAVPMQQLRRQGGRIVMPGATRASIEALPTFEYADDTSRRDRVLARAERDIAKARARITDLRRQAGSADSATRTQLDLRRAGLEAELEAAEDALDRMKRIGAQRWKELEAAVGAATARLRESSADRYAG